MNKWRLMGIVSGILAIAILLGMVISKGGIKPIGADKSDGAEIELKEDADSFPCSCGCGNESEMQDCQCENCAESDSANESQSEEGSENDIEDGSENENQGSYFYEDPDTGEMVALKVDSSKLTRMDEAAVADLILQIENCESISIRRCESSIYDNGTDEPKFKAISESRYYYSAASNKVYNADGEDITEKLDFSVNDCADCFDFLEQYFISRGISTDFVTDDLSHTKDLLLGQRVYSFGVEECEEIAFLKERMDGVEITEEDCTYQVKTYEDGTDRIMYVTVTVAGTDADGATVVRYITYIIDYDCGIPAKEVAD